MQVGPMPDDVTAVDNPWDVPEDGPNVVPISVTIGGTLDECETLVKSIRDGIRGVVDGCLASCDGVAADCRSCVGGAIERKLQDVSGVGAKCRGKLCGQMDAILGEAYSYARSIGYEIPTSEEIGAFLCTGTIAPPPLPPTGSGGETTCPPCDLICPGGGSGGDIMPPLPPSPPIVVPPMPPYPGGSGSGGSCPAPVVACPNPVVTVNVQPPIVNLPPNFFSPPVSLPPDQILPPPEPYNCPPGQHIGPSGFCEPDPGPPVPPVIIPPVPLQGPFNPTEHLPGWNADWNFPECPSTILPPEPTNVAQLIPWLEEKSGFKKVGQMYEFPLAMSGLAHSSTNPSIGELIVFYVGWGLSVGVPAIVAAIIPAGMGCNFGAVAFPVLLRGMLGTIEKWAGIDLSFITEKMSLDINLQCPAELPGQGDIDRLRLSGLIGFETWRCWTRAIGNMDVPADLVWQAGQPWPDPSLNWKAWKIGTIDEGTYKRNMQRVGYSDPLNSWIPKAMAQYVPGPGDIVSFMLRDVFDAQIVQQFQLDDEFGAKFTGDAKKWAAAGGVDEDTMKYFWRAHWKWPSASQLYEMLHRLRPDAANRPADVDAVTDADVLTVLGVNDVAPVWRKRLAAISYKPVNRLELRRQYANKLIDAKGFISGLQDLGYGKKAAQELEQLFSKLNDMADEKASRTLSVSAISNYYASGGLSYKEAYFKLNEMGLAEKWIDRILSDASLKATAATRKERIGNLKRRFMRGEFDAATAIGAVIALGIDADQANTIVGGWDQSLKLKDKNPSISQLCKWQDMGLISTDEFMQRLVNFGWTKVDAARIVVQCLSANAEKHAKEIARLQKAADAAAKKRGT